MNHEYCGVVEKARGGMDDVSFDGYMSDRLGGLRPHRFLIVRYYLWKFLHPPHRLRVVACLLHDEHLAVQQYVNWPTHCIRPTFNMILPVQLRCRHNQVYCNASFIAFYIIISNVSPYSDAPSDNGSLHTICGCASIYIPFVLIWAKNALSRKSLHRH
jgi:hypothetical protein